MEVKSVAVLGAGHGGCAAAADLGKRGYSVRLHARNAERLAPLRAQDGIEARGIVQGLIPIDLLTTDVGEAVGGADLIMLVVPSVAHGYYARALAPLLDGGQITLDVREPGLVVASGWLYAGVERLRGRVRRQS